MNEIQGNPWEVYCFLFFRLERPDLSGGRDAQVGGRFVHGHSPGFAIAGLHFALCGMILGTPGAHLQLEIQNRKLKIGRIRNQNSGSMPSKPEGDSCG
jgi:hypothetical protein